MNVLKTGELGKSVNLSAKTSDQMTHQLDSEIHDIEKAESPIVRKEELVE